MGDNKGLVLDYTSVCRTCLKSAGEMQNLSALIHDNLGTGEIQLSYMECLRYCLTLDEAQVEMPTKICRECASALQVAYWFMKNACKAQELLKVRLKELQEKRKQIERQAFAETLKKPKRYRCKICNVRLETKRSLKDHVKVHLDIIIYSCQMCEYENNKRNYLIEHYQLAHDLEATSEQLKPKTKTTPSTATSASSTTTNASTTASIHYDFTDQALVEQQLQTHPLEQTTQGETFMDTSHSIQEVYTTATPSQQNSEFIYTTSNTSTISMPLEGNTTIFTQPNGETYTFNTFEGGEVNMQNDLGGVGNEFIVMADGTVQDSMGRGVVILQSSDDGSLALQNGLVLENLIQVPNAETANMIMSQNDIVQMDVDDLIVEDPQNSPEQLQDVPSPVDEDMIPATIIKKINCKICTKDFDSQGELKNHMLTHNEIPHFFCECCNFYTFFKIDLHQHYKSKHNVHPTTKQLQPKNKQRTLGGGSAPGAALTQNDTEIPKKNVVVQKIERYAKSPRMVYYCDICYYECDLKYEIKRHYSTKHKVQVTEVHQRVSKSPADTLKINPKTTSGDQVNLQISSADQGLPDYPNGLNCRKCNEIFYWRNELYEHYKLHNAEEAAVKQQKQALRTQRQQVQVQTPAINVNVDTQLQLQPQTQPQPQVDIQQPQMELQQQSNELESQQQQTQHVQYQQQHQHQETIITTASNLENPLQTFDNVDPMSLVLTPNNTFNNPAPLTPSSSSTYTLPSDAIPQIVEMEQTIETDMDFDFNGDALFEDFDDVENESDDNDLRNIVLTSDDDYEDTVTSQNEAQQTETTTATTETPSFCAQCQKSFLSHYQFENHTFLHRGLAPYRCEMCTNLYNTKRALIRHYRAIHKKVPSRDMIQAKGDKVYIYDKTPMDYLNIEESKSITLMCAKCTYESIDFPSVQLHLNTNHSIHEDTYILKKLPFECPRCIRSFASKTKLLRHLERNHSAMPINLHQVHMNSSNTATTTTTTTTAPSLNNNVNMMQMNAECEQHESQKITELDDDNKFNTIRNCLASSTVLANYNGEDVATGIDSFSNSNFKNEVSNTLNSNCIKAKDPSMLKLNAQTEELNNQSLENDNPPPPSNDPVTSSVIIYICHLCHIPCYTLESVIVHGKGVNCSSLHKLSNKECPLFKCELCQCKYKSLNLLTVHLKRHTVRKFRCTLCANTYVSKIELDFHQRSHRNERPHKCDLCPSSFRYVHHLKRHKDIIHFGKRHMCPEPNCNRQFTTLDQLKIHKWSHYGIVPYKCKYCERLFKKRFLLRDHCLKAHNIRLTEDEVADIFRLSLGYTSPHDLTLAVRNGNMLMPDVWESLPPSLQ